MAGDRYVAYVGTYTKGSSEGIYILDFDAEKCCFTKRKAIPANNPSDILVSNSGKFLYSTTDQGVNSYRITVNGDLEFMNTQWTGGMRGSYLETDPADRFLFVAGYYDGRISVMNISESGSVGEIADGVFHQGMSVDESGNDSMPHITCVKLLPDLKGIFAVDNGLEQVISYSFDEKTGKLSEIGVLRCDLDSHPRLIRVNWEKKFIYLLCERTNDICVYKYTEENDLKKGATLEPLQKITTLGEDRRKKVSSFGMDFTPDGRHLFVSNTVANTVMVYDVDPESGLLTQNCCGSLSGEYPKSVAALPDNDHFVALGLNTGTLTVYQVNYEEHYFLMSAKPILIDQPNSIYIHKLI